MKTAAMILIMLLSACVGAYGSLRLKKRKEEWQNLCTDFRTLAQETETYKTPAAQAIRKMTCKSRLFSALADCRTDDVSEAYRSVGTGAGLLSRQDGEMLAVYFEKVGKLDSSAREKLAEEYIKKAELEFAESKERYQKYGKLWSVGSLMAGLFAVIAIW